MVKPEPLAATTVLPCCSPLSWSLLIDLRCVPSAWGCWGSGRIITHRQSGRNIGQHSILCEYRTCIADSQGGKIQSPWRQARAQTLQHEEIQCVPCSNMAFPTYPFHDFLRTTTPTDTLDCSLHRIAGTAIIRGILQPYGGPEALIPCTKPQTPSPSRRNLLVDEGSCG
ncbi:hypothetical protein B0T10DRAFT_165753 [Thelonectria olida]|uniref:Uncharacterized protein n=1 Tax=Thelonectria olida TaxID=1576542 RepID=A0A9P8WH80_9HYPO|nr:hypothetical protein B0T10DRAFT_165753 [Thelonectria olida]